MAEEPVIHYAPKKKKETRCGYLWQEVKTSSDWRCVNCFLCLAKKGKRRKR